MDYSGDWGWDWDWNWMLGGEGIEGLGRVLAP